MQNGINRAIIRRVSSQQARTTLGCRQAVRHQTLTLAFVGSNPAIPANDPLAQSVEQLPFKQWVWSSSLQRVTNKEKPRPPRRGFLYSGDKRRLEKRNARVRWTLACRRLDGGNTIIFAAGKNVNESPAGHFLQSKNGTSLQRVTFAKQKWNGSPAGHFLRSKNGTGLQRVSLTSPKMRRSSGSLFQNIMYRASRMPYIIYIKSPTRFPGWGTFTFSSICPDGT